MVKKTVRTETAAVFVDASEGAFLHYEVAFEGEQAEFAIVDSVSRNVLLSHKAGTFARDWPLPADPVSQMTSHVAALHFVLAVKYTYRVELHGPGGTVRTLIDIDYESSDSTDTAFQELGITID
jgi:hypothetical protein